jgi:hypothetical protein
MKQVRLNKGDFMRIEIMPAIDKNKLIDSIRFHNVLNPALWKDDELRLNVRVALLKIALTFYKYLEVDGLVVVDVIIAGSNCNYNYTPLSDIDLHLVVDYAKSVCPELAENFFTAKKARWNDLHNVSVKGYNVELYVEDFANAAVSNGRYSILKGEWLSHPQQIDTTWNDRAVIAKTQDYADMIEYLIDNDATVSQYEKLVDKIWNMRKAGLAKGGEMSVENLTFKSLRNLGYLDRLKDAKIEAEDRELTLEALQ